MWVIVGVVLGVWLLINLAVLANMIRLGRGKTERGYYDGKWH